MARVGRIVYLKFAIVILLMSTLWLGLSIEVLAGPVNLESPIKSVISPDNSRSAEPRLAPSPENGAGNSASQNCPSRYRVKWPEDAPVWSFCWLPPDRSKGINGSGLEIYNVSYKGKRVLTRANLPVLNVKYAPAECMNSRSFRDWQDELVPFKVDNVVRSGYAEPTEPPKTVCDNPGRDVGQFEGVTLQRNPERLLLTTQMRAGWYRYIQRWAFFADGTIRPQLGFSAVKHGCTNKAHVHHAYWRFDFDIEGAENDGIDEFNSGTWTALATETNRLKSAETERKWRVLDRATNRGYQIVPSAEEGLPADEFGIADVWALKYKTSERQDDGGALIGDNRAQMNKYINGEEIDGENNVVWYHVSYRHESGPTCQLLGPELKLVGSW